MRINQFVAQATGMSRRAADAAVQNGSVTINNQLARQGQQVDPRLDTVLLNKTVLSLPERSQTILLNKPVGYVCSREGQGGKTVYDLLPSTLHHLKPVGRLDKDSSGLLLLTTDGQFAHALTHPSFRKEKRYIVSLDKPLRNTHQDQLTRQGVKLDDGISKFKRLTNLSTGASDWEITLTEGRNRQIRRTFAALGYRVSRLHRQQFGDYTLGALSSGRYISI